MHLLSNSDDATLFFSQDTLNLAMVIPAMDHIDEVLSSQSLDHRYDVSICASLGLAKKTLNHYYSMTDMSEVYRIAMGMYLIDLSTSSANCVYYLLVLHPLAQAELFQNCKMGVRMDSGGQGDHSFLVRMLVQTL